MPTLNDVLAGSLAQAVQVQQIIDALKGTPNKGVPISLTALNDAGNYALTVQNDDPTNSRALLVLKADGTTLIEADGTGVTLASPLHIPAGSIGSTEILDGSVNTVDMAANAVTRLVASYNATPTFSTTSTTTTITPVIATGTFYGGNIARVDLGVPLSHSVTGSLITAWLYMDGVSQGVIWAQHLFQGGSIMYLSSSWLVVGITAGSHTMQLALTNGNGSGTMSIHTLYASQMNVTEYKR